MSNENFDFILPYINNLISIPCYVATNELQPRNNKRFAAEK